MNKDLSKEYKEAVMNDLPDLWGKIEAAIDAEEKDNKTVTETADIKEKPANLTLVSNNTDEPVFKETEPVAQVKKKKKKIPAWVLISIPSAAILLIAVVPLMFFGAAIGLGKSATNAMYDAAPTSEAAADCASYEEASYDYIDAAVGDVAEAEDDSDTKNYATSEFNYKGENVNLDRDFTLGEQVDGNSLAPTPGEAEEDGATVTASEANGNEDIVESDHETAIASVLLITEDENGEKLAYVCVHEVLGDERLTCDDFKGFEAGDSFDAYIDPKSDITEGKKYEVVISFHPEIEGAYMIKAIDEIGTND